MEKKLARVSKAHLEIQERGILNFWVFVDYEEGCSQGVGGICLDTYDDQLKSRVGSAYGCEMIRQMLFVFGVNDFSEMKGKLIYVLGEGKGLSFQPGGFERLNLDRNNAGLNKIVFKEVAEMFLIEEK